MDPKSIPSGLSEWAVSETLVRGKADALAVASLVSVCDSVQEFDYEEGVVIAQAETEQEYVYTKNPVELENCR